jgi:hypothetical protein
MEEVIQRKAIWKARGIKTRKRKMKSLWKSPVRKIWVPVRREAFLPSLQERAPTLGNLEKLMW